MIPIPYLITFIGAAIFTYGIMIVLDWPKKNSVNIPSQDVDHLKNMPTKSGPRKEMPMEKVGLSSQELKIILGHIAHGVTAIDSKGSLIYANEIAAKMCGFGSLQDFLETPLHIVMERFEILDEEGNKIAAEDMPSKKAFLGIDVPEVVIQFKGDGFQEERWSLLKSTPIFDEQKKVSMVINVFKDITASKKSEASARRAVERQKFLSQAGELLSASLNYEETLKRIAYLSVPQLADWAAVDTVDKLGNIKRLAVAHQNPDKIKFAYEVSEKYPAKNDSLTGIPAVLRTGKSEFYPVITNEMITATASNNEEASLIRLLGLTSVIIVPLKILNKVVGVITFANAESGAHYTQADLETAEELARRASLAVQNARLYEVTQDILEKERHQTELFDTILTNAPIGVAFLNKNLEFVVVNEKLAQINGFEVGAHTGKNIFQIFPDYEVFMKPNFQFVLEKGKPLLNFEASSELPGQPGKMRHWNTSYYPVRDRVGEISGVGMIVQEITEQREAEKEIYFRAYHDPLTHLPNRKAFEEALQKNLDKAKATQSRFSVMFLDMDRLKDINDSLGHDIGDEVLKEISDRLKSIIGTQDMVARWGGDEFVILLPEILGSSDAVRLAEKILAVIEPVMRIRSHSLHITASIGIAIFPVDGEDVQSLQKNADTALYRAKESGRNKYEMYTRSMNVKARERLSLENDLRQALRRKEFSLDYQPLFDLKSRSTKSVETLLRWQHPRLGVLHPKKFLNIAEEIGLIARLGNWVARTAAKDLQELSGQGIFLQAAVNISARQFSEDRLVENILEGLHAAHYDPAHFEIEITESLAMENLDRTKATLLRLKEKGISITVDDFGTGYSSLNYLKRLPIDKLKIDKSFVRHMITDEQDMSIIKAIISMAKSLHIKVVAEGVNTETQLNLLASLGCDAVQGYYISKPLSKLELVEFMGRKDLPLVFNDGDVFTKEFEKEIVA